MNYIIGVSITHVLLYIYSIVVEYLDEYLYQLYKETI